MITWLPIFQFREADYPGKKTGFIVGYWLDHCEARHQSLWIVEYAIYSKSMGWRAPDGRRLYPSHFDYFQPPSSELSSPIAPSESFTPNLDKLRDIIDKFKALLDDPRRARELVQFLTGDDDATPGSRK